MIPIMRPLLPTRTSLTPYLDRIDENRWYSNSGSLVREIEERISKKFGCYVVTASSATSALTACLIAQRFPRGVRLKMPSWTFCATANAMIAAGLVPEFVDVGEFAHIGVSNFGAINEYESGIAVDAASGFDCYSFSSKTYDTPHIFSTHCTKVFSSGEGGFVLTRDKRVAEEIRVVLNNGFSKDRSINGWGVNGKMSEYHAAVGLAELDGWEEKRQRWLEVQGFYGDDKPWVNSTHSVMLDVPAKPIVEKLKGMGIEARTSWYGLHREKAYSQYKDHDLPVTDGLIDHTIFLPKFIGMTKDEVCHIKVSLESACA